MDSEVESVYVLVDWDNLERSFPGRNQGENVGFALRERMAVLVADRFPSAIEAEIRCYSGWLEATGAPSRTALALRPRLEALNARVDGLAMRVECVDNMLIDGAPGIYSYLAGPRECRCPARNPIFEQKMVDTMIVADASVLAEYQTVATVIVGDDIDLAPGVVMAGLQRAYVTKRSSALEEIVWIRRRASTRQTRMVESVATVEEW